MGNSFLRIPQLAILSGLKRHTLNARIKNTFGATLNRNSGNQILLEPSQVKTVIADRITNNPGKIIYIGNLKGGVGKTTLSYLISNTVASLGLKTCVIDLDVQSNLTRQYANTSINQPVFYDVIDNKRDIQEVILPISETLHIIPSSLKNSLIQKALSMQAPKHHLSWFNNICLDYLRTNFDVIIVNRFFQSQKNNLELLVKMGQVYGDMLSETIIRDNAKVREVINNKTAIGNIKQGKELYEVLSNLLQEFNVLRKVEN